MGLYRGLGGMRNPPTARQKQVNMGMKVEREHSNSKSVRTKIVNDHLAEDPNYYTKLKKAGL